MTQATSPDPPSKPPRTTRLNTMVTAALLGLLLLAWLLAWQDSLSQRWPQLLLTQSGNFSYLLMALSATLGPLIGARVLPQWLTGGIKAGWHGVLSGFALVIGAIHGLFATVGPQPFSLTQVIVPGLGTLTSAMGTLALWGLLLVYVTWALRGRLGMQAARALHLLAYPAFMAATLHGVWLGHGVVAPTYTLASAAVGGALAMRLFTLANR